MPPVLYEAVVEVEGKVILSQDGQGCQLAKEGCVQVPADQTLTGESVHVLAELNEAELRADLAGLLAKVWPA